MDDKRMFQCERCGQVGELGAQCCSPVFNVLSMQTDEGFQPIGYIKHIAPPSQADLDALAELSAEIILPASEHVFTQPTTHAETHENGYTERDRQFLKDIGVQP